MKNTLVVAAGEEGLGPENSLALVMFVWQRVVVVVAKQRSSPKDVTTILLNLNLKL